MTPLTVFENLALLFPLHIQRIAEIAPFKPDLQRPSERRYTDLADLFVWSKTEEGYWYWAALACGNGVP